jgi:hypothetical protein
LFPIVGHTIARRSGELLKADGKPKMTEVDGLRIQPMAPIELASEISSDT